ncbi:MAG: sugar phosphate isomerase/epimerase family protein [Desulfococcaceae bacterium]|nr:sugar phosphate isomerase/epimerase family protein [Desulfococcaceae bacterium]
MPFVRMPGVTGKVYVPEEQPRDKKKHNCKDCFACQHCSDDRCNLCREKKPCQKERKKMNNIKDIVHVCIKFGMLGEKRLEQFLREGIRPEIAIHGGVLDSVPLSEFRRIAELFRSRGLAMTLHGPFIDMSPGSEDTLIRAASRQRFEQLLKLIPVFQPRSVVCHAGYDEKRYGFFRETWLENSLAFWQWFAGRLQDAGTRLMLENVYEHYPENIRILFENLQKYGAGFCLDIGHCKVFSRSSLKTWLESLGTFLGQLHLHDNAGLQDEHLAPGKGTLDFPFLFQWLKEHRDRPPLITMETHREADLYPGLTYLQKIWPWEPLSL